MLMIIYTTPLCVRRDLLEFFQAHDDLAQEIAQRYLFIWGQVQPSKLTINTHLP